MFFAFSIKAMAILLIVEEGIIKKLIINFQITVDILIDNDYHYRIKIIPPLQYSVERMNFSYFSPEVC